MAWNFLVSQKFECVFQKYLNECWDNITFLCENLNLRKECIQPPGECIHFAFGSGFGLHHLMREIFGSLAAKCSKIPISWWLTACQLLGVEQWAFRARENRPMRAVRPEINSLIHRPKDWHNKLEDAKMMHTGDKSLIQITDKLEIKHFKCCIMTSNASHAVSV